MRMNTIILEKAGRNGLIHRYSFAVLSLPVRDRFQRGWLSLKDYMIIRIKRENTARHFFSRELAQGINHSLGIKAAILLTDLARNIESINNYRDKHSGWYYSTLDQFCQRHPYLSRATINRILVELRDDGILKTTDEFNKKKYDRTLWYSIPDRAIMKLAASREDMISFVVSDALKYGIEAAILLSNFKYWVQYNNETEPWHFLKYEPMSPAELSDRDIVDLPIEPWTIRRALNVLVKRGALEREQNKEKGDSCYLYRLAEGQEISTFSPDRNFPTECTPHLN